MKRTDRHTSQEQGTHNPRRDFLKGAGAATLVTGLGAAVDTAGVEGQQPSVVPQSARETGAFRFAFMPCIHLRDDLRSPEGMATALRAVEKLNPRPAFILTGGDLCHNLRDEGLTEATKRADLFVKILRENTRLPVRHLLGNHDPAGWRRGEFPKGHPDFGMNLLKNKLDMKSLYYSFDQAGWHFVVLDNIWLTEPGKFITDLDAEQLTWLRADLAKNKQRPTIIATHVPVVSAIELLSDRAKRGEGEVSLDFTRVASDANELLNVLRTGNVKALISGHLHLVERLNLMGYDFICSGSVSAQQWTGHRMNTPEGFGIFDCQPDGTYSFAYQTYDWQAAPAKGSSAS